MGNFILVGNARATVDLTIWYQPVAGWLDCIYHCALWLHVSNKENCSANIFTQN